MMDYFSTILRTLPNKVFALFGGSPHRYWNGLLLALAFIFLAIVIFDFSIYRKATEYPVVDISEEAGKELKKIDEKRLKNVSEIFRAKEKASSEVFSRPNYTDPSL